MRVGAWQYVGWLLMVALCGCNEKVANPSSDTGSAPGVTAAASEFLSDHENWRRWRAEDLRKPGGWMDLAGLYWVRSKRHLIGSAPGNGMRLPSGPAWLGVLAEERPGEFYFVPDASSAATYNGEPLKGRIRFHSDKDPEPGVIGFDEGKGMMTLIRRGGRYAVRVWRIDAEMPPPPPVLDYWPADPGWRIPGRFVAAPAGRTLPITHLIGVVDHLPNPGAVEFQRNGKTYRLETLGSAEGPLSIVFADLTSGQSSYATGRYLDIEAPDAAGNVVLDFNRAYNPPSAFTPYSTSLVAPESNRMDIAVTAGEKYQPQPSSLQ